MVKPRKEEVEYRNIRLRIETYKRLEEKLLHYIHHQRDPKISLDRVLNLMMDDLDNTKRMIDSAADKVRAEFIQSKK